MNDPIVLRLHEDGMGGYAPGWPRRDLRASDLEALAAQWELSQAEIEAAARAWRAGDGQPLYQPVEAPAPLDVAPRKARAGGGE